ncbi:MAG: RNA polymerase sigma factor [Bacteroidia bacterium]
MTPLSEKTPDKHTDQYYLDGIQKGQQDVLNAVYSRHFALIQRYIENNDGTREDGRDIFQDALVLIYQRLNSPNKGFVLTSTFGTYLFSVCKYLWMNQLRKKGRKVLSIENQVDIASDWDIDSSQAINERNKLFQEKLKELGEDCQRLLMLFFQKTPMLQIAEVMGFKSVQYAKKRKFTCKEQLIKRIKADRRYTELLDF